MQMILLLLIPVVCFYLMEAFDRNPFEQIRPYAQFFNILLFELIGLVLFFLTGRAKWSIRILTVLTLIFGLVNHFVLEFRSTPFVPWDIFSIGTAASVVGEYDFTLSNRVITVILSFLIILVLSEMFTLRIRTLRIRLIPAAASGAALCIFYGMLQNEEFWTAYNLYPYLFTPTVMTKYNGTLVTFVMDLQYVIVEKPEGYDSEEAEELLASYETTEEADTETLPSIIVVMDEAFSDLAVLGDFTASEDYMPYIHSLQEGAENTITGTLHVSVCGGNTANTEYEFLTGNTMAFLPSGSIPYQQYVKQETPSLASYLASLGYATYAVHPYNASGWNRNTVYPLLGIETFYSLKDFVDPTYIRNYVSDESSFDRIIEIYEQKEENQPVFIFNVTMQNHGSYTSSYENFTPDITVEGTSSYALWQYLSLLKVTDAQFEELTAYFAQQEEPVMIIFFGDHQPANSVVSQIWSLNGVDSGNLTEEQEQLRYEVPYVIWANFDIEEASGLETSVNYLAAEALSAAGVPLSAYQNYLLELKEEYPVISAARIDGDEDSDTLTQYNRLQYYLMYDYE